MEQKFGGVMPYPTGIKRRLYRFPIYLHRMGLGALNTFWPIMILTTRGWKSGKPRFTALEYRRHGSKIYAVSLWGERPQWYHNILASPEATIQIGPHVYHARASAVDNPAEAVRVLYMFHRTAPFIYDAILARMSTASSIDLNTLTGVADQFTIVRLDIVPGKPELPIVAVDRRWMWRAGAVLAILVGLAGWVRSKRSSA